MSLDSYLEGLTKEAERKKVEQVYLKTASDEELLSIIKEATPQKEKKAASPLVIGTALGAATGSLEAGSRDRGGGAAAGLIGGAVGALATGTLGARLGGEATKGLGGLIAGAYLGGIIGGLGGGALAGSIVKQRRENLGKKKSAALLEAGDAAGRVLAKLGAAPMRSVRFKGSEVQEALEEAKAREDIEGRSRRWQLAGGALGAGIGAGASGALGGMIAKGLGAKSALTGTALGMLGGGLGGGYLGARIGKQEGAEEAAADQIVAAMRARRNQNIGAVHGYMAARRPFQSRR